MKETIKKIRVIRTTRGWVQTHEYSQGISSCTYTYDILKALHVIENAFEEHCLFGDSHKDECPHIECYKITIEKL